MAEIISTLFRFTLRLYDDHGDDERLEQASTASLKTGAMRKWCRVTMDLETRSLALAAAKVEPTVNSVELGRAWHALSALSCAGRGSQAIVLPGVTILEQSRESEGRARTT